MARGWESKSVEEQQTEKLSHRAPDFLPPTANEQERESLILQRKRIAAEMDRSTNPRFKAQQEKSLSFLDRKLEKFRDFNLKAGK